MLGLQATFQIKFKENGEHEFILKNLIFQKVVFSNFFDLEMQQTLPLEGDIGLQATFLCENVLTKFEW